MVEREEREKIASMRYLGCTGESSFHVHMSEKGEVEREREEQR